MRAQEFLSGVGEQVKSGFVESRTILSFSEWMDVFFQHPRLQARNAAQYVRDVFDHFGSEQVAGPRGTVRRFKLFDSVGGEGRDVRVAGQEEVQNAIYRAIGNFVRAGRVNKLILLHGPNGSAKSSLVGAIVRGLEQYSHTPQGAQYRINWVFPSSKLVRGPLGFGDKVGSGNEPSSYAHLEGEAIDARIGSELRDHPLFLIPRAERRKLLEEHCRARDSEGSSEQSDFVLSDWILEGELSHKSRQIHAALLQSHGGDWMKVLRHVQVERFFVSRRYQTAAVTVEPQMSIDASVQQVTADRSVANLPAALQNVDLFDAHGPLVAANRGVIEYADLLKRPLEAFKYLLGTIESATVPMEPFVLQLDLVLLASSNEKHLAAFKEHPDFASFKGRIELVRVPYLRQVSVERRIYEARVTPAAVGKPVAPHALEVAAYWAVLTRLKKPMVERLPSDLRASLESLTPTEKLRLYDQGLAPDRLDPNQAKELQKQLGLVWHESDSYPQYEGRQGASAREILTVLLNAAQNENRHALDAPAVLEELEALCRDVSVYEFLQQEVVGGFHDHAGFVKQAEAHYLDLLDEEVRDAMGLVSEQQYRQLFERYIALVSAWVKGEKVSNRMTGRDEKPDEAVMKEMENILLSAGEDATTFRRGLISRIGAWKLDHPEPGPIEWAKAVPDHFKRIRDHSYGERKRQLRRVRDNFFRWLGGDSGLLPREAAQIEEMVAALVARHGYDRQSAKDAVLFLMKRRYAD